MPNHVTNKIRIQCDTMGLEEFKNQISGENGVIDFEKIIPMPGATIESKDVPMTGEEMGRNPFNWYDWSIANWGTKWNAYDIRVQDEWDGGDNCEMEIHFDTAWSAPFPIINALRDIEGVNVWGHYVEEFAESAGVF